MNENSRQSLEQALQEVQEARKEGYATEGILADVELRLEGVLHNAEEHHLNALQEALQHFEDDHPKLANHLKSAIQALSNMGI